MRKVCLVFLLFFAFACSAIAQISANGADKVMATNYTNIAPNDSIYTFCGIKGANGVRKMGSLTATPIGGTPNYTFDWQIFNPNTFVYDPYTTTVGLTSTINNLVSGGYNVVITDANGNKQCQRAWVYVDSIVPKIQPIVSNCDTIKLNATVRTSGTFTYYDPPPTSLIINQFTTVTVCFDALHTYVSDLGFFLIGPPSCGSPTIALANPIAGANGGNNCNSGDDVTGLCFSTASANVFNGCVPAPPHTLSGTYASNNPWNPIFGCDAATPGWAVQIYDCVGADVGVLTHASILFQGTSTCGPAQFLYDSGPIQSVINDNSCTPQTASIYVVPPATPVTHQINIQDTAGNNANNLNLHYKWTSSPYVIIPYDTDTLNARIFNNLPQQDTWFYLTVYDSLSACPVWVDSAKYTYPNIQTVVQTVDDTCGTGWGIAKVQVTGGKQPYKYTWDDPLAQTTDSASRLRMGTYNVVIEDSNGCKVTAQAVIGTQPLPKAEFIPDPDVISLLDPVCTFINKSKNGIKWNWNFGDGDTSSLENPTHAYDKEGSYEIKLVIENQFGCKDSVVHTILVESYFTFYIPNAFTPNSNGINDEYIPKMFGVINDGYDFRVYDRWGNEIFKSNDINKGWKGNINEGNNRAMSDVYVYIINFTDFKFKKHKVVGHVTLVK